MQGSPATFTSSEGSGAVTGALAQALRAVLILTPQTTANERSLIPLWNQSGSQDALQAARLGNWRLADQYELAWRNAWRILPAVPAAEAAEQLDRGYELMAFSIDRNAGPRGATLIEWSWVRPCPRCRRRLARRAKCPVCNGNGHVGDEREIFYADLDGNVVME